MQEVVGDTIQADSVIVDSLKVVDLPLRDSNLITDMSQMFGELAVKNNCFVDGLVEVSGETLSVMSVMLFLFVLVSYILVIVRYPKEIVSISKIMVFPTLFNKTQEVNSVHLKHYLTYAFIFSVIVLSILSWIYVANGNLIVPVMIYLYVAFKAAIPKIMAIKQGRRSPISLLTYFIVSFYTTTLLVMSPIALASIVFGPIRILYILIITVLSSYYVLLARYFYKEKFSFKQFLLYLCTAEVLPLALVICLFYTKIIAFGN